MIIPDFSKLKTNQWNEKHFKIHYAEFYDWLFQQYTFAESFTEKIYCYINNVTTRPVCKHCSGQVKFISVHKGYLHYCSSKCAANSDEKQEKIKNTCLERYNAKNNLHIPKVQEKIKNNWVKKYGFNNPAKSQIIKDKVKQTCLERYGTECALQNKEIDKKTQKTNLEKYGVERFTNREKAQETFLKKYNVKWAIQSEQVKQKINDTCIEKYGVEFPLMSDDIRKKSEKTNLEKYGKTTYFGSDDWKEKTLKTCLSRYGKTTYFGSDDCIQKSKQTCLDKYGFKYPSQIDGVKKKIKETKDKNHTHNSSSIEEQFNAWLIENKINFKRQYSSDKYPFCCDFYFPDKDLYFEINGHWTHGGHPFDYNSKDDLDIVNKWEKLGTEFYNNAIKTWTIRDVEKVKTAIKNKLNYKVIYSCKLSDVIKEYNN